MIRDVHVWNCMASVHLQDSEPVHFRYKIQQKSTVMALKPKKLDDELNKFSLRATQLGAMFYGQFHKLPCTDVFRVLWEVRFVSIYLFLFPISIFADLLWL